MALAKQDSGSKKNTTKEQTVSVGGRDVNVKTSTPKYQTKTQTVSVGGRDVKVQAKTPTYGKSTTPTKRETVSVGGRDITNQVQQQRTREALNVPKTHPVVEKVNNALNSLFETAGTETGRMKLRNDYTQQRNQTKLDIVNRENQELVSQTTAEDYARMFDNNGNRVDNSQNIESIKAEIAKIDSGISLTGNESVDASEIARRNELQGQLDDFELLDKKAKALEETYIQEELRKKGDINGLNSYQEMLSHKNDNMVERFGNVMNHLGNTTANIVPTAFDQMKQLGTNAYAKENIAELDRLHESGEIDDGLYKESLAEWQDYIDRHKSTNSDNLSQIIRANADQISANTYYGANEVEKFVLQAGESTAQFLLHYAILGQAATVSMSLASGTDKMNQLLMQGVDPQTAAQNGLLTGLTSYVTEKIGMDRFVNMMGTPFSADALGSILVNHIKAGVSEGLEEVAEGLVDPLIDSVTLGVPYEVNGDELKMEFLLGGASGLAMAIGGTAIGTVDTAIKVNSFLNERRDVRENVQNKIGQLVVNSQYQKNLLTNELNMFRKHYDSMTDYQKQVADELIAKGQNAIKEYERMSQVQGVTFSADIPYESTTEENDHAIFEAYTPDFNNEVQFEKKISETENIISDLMDSQLAIDNAVNETQQILNENGYNIDAKVFNSLSEEQKQKTLVALDFANITGMNVNIVNDLPQGQHGYVDSKGNITIDASKNPVLFTLSHELTHGTESSKYYSALKNLVMSNIEGDWNELVNKKIEDYAKGNIPLDFENAEKEVVARYVEDKLGDEKFIEDLIRYNYSIASRIYQDLKSMGSDDEVVRIRNTFEKAFSENYQQAKADGQSDFSYDADVTNNMSEDVDIEDKIPEEITGKAALRFSYEKNGEITQAQDELYEKKKTELLNLYNENGQNISEEEMNEMLEKAHEDMEVFADLMKENSSLLPNEVIGRVLLKDASYGYSVENSTKCPRTLAYDELTNYVTEKVGRPLTAIESFLVSQKLYSIAVEPQCLYCYVALDRKSYNEFVGRYIEQRDEAIRNYVDAGSPKLPSSFNEAINNELFLEFLDGRKPTTNMWGRYSSWINAYNKGEKLLTKNDVRNDWSRGDIKNSKGPEWEQLKDMLAYAQSASWAKKAIDYRAYLDDIRKLSQRQVNNLNKHYGLRWYSFNDYTPAYILENMQQFVDASLKGLKGLAYTKDTDFARIFAPTGVNINISMYVTRDADGNFIIDPVMSADLQEAIELREQYPNVGIVVTGTDSEAVRWALAQPWTDVVIPFHIVRTGADIAEYYKWTVFNAQQNDTVIDDEVWKQYVESLTGVSREDEKAFKKAEKKTSKMIYPSEHQNDRETFLRLCEERGLKPRFSEFLDDPNYMKLVNETRQSDAETGYLVPKFNIDAAYDSFEWFKNKGGFYGGWWKDNVELTKESNEVANDILAIEQGEKKYEDIKYGEGYVDFDKYKTMLKNRKKLNKKHGTGTAFRYSFEDETPLGETEMSDEQMNLKPRVPTSKDIESEKTAQVLENQPKQKTKLKDIAGGAVTEAKGLTVSRYAAVEELAEKTGNKKLINLADEVLRAYAMANRSIYNGMVDKNTAKTIGKSLTDVMGEIPDENRHLFDEYLYHWRNVDEMTMEERFAKKDLADINKQLKDLRKKTDKESKKKVRELEKRKKELKKIQNNPVFGDSITADDSRDFIEKTEKEHPEFKEIAKEMWDMNRQYLKMRQDSGIISEETYNDFVEKRPHYIPISRDIDSGRGGVSPSNPNDIKKFKGSRRDIKSVEDTMKKHIQKTYQVISQNDLNREIIKTYGGGENIESDELIDLIEEGFNPAVQNPSGRQISAYVDGQKVTIPVSKEMYEAIAPGKLNESNLKAAADLTLANLTKWRKALITSKNPIFALFTNPLKDIQDAIGQTKYRGKLGENYVKFLVKAANEIRTNGEYSQMYDNLGLRQSQMIGKEISEAFKQNKESKKFFDNLFEAAETMEKIPRLAEFMASLDDGNSIQQAAYDAADVTTNFKRGGTLTKMVDKYGAPFLNPSVQGFDKQIRNAKGDIDTIRKNGAKGVLSVLVRLTLASGIPLRLLQDWLWRDDDEYQELSDYIKSGYYILPGFKGRFIRIPKGRVAAFWQTVMTGGYKFVTQQTDVWNMLLDDWQSFEDNVAPNKVSDSFIGSPIYQAIRGKTWYGEDIVPKRLQDDPASEQYDESTDLISIKLGELSRLIADKTGNDKFQLSPYKINYVLDQYSGIVGDVVLPALTLETEVGIDNPIIKGPATAILDKFTTDPVLKNQNVTTFYDLMNNLKVKQNSAYAKDEEKLAYKYLSSVASQMSKLYDEKRNIQGNRELSNKEKIELVRKIQNEINVYAKAGLANYDNIDIVGSYAAIGGVQYYKNEEGKWTKTRKETLEKLNNADLSMEDRGYFYDTNEQIANIREEIKNNTPDGERASYAKDTIDAINNSKLSAKGKNTLYDSFYSGKATEHINSMNLTDEQKYDLKVANQLAEGRKDENGKTISNSKAEATAEAYEKLGLLDDVVKYIKDNDIAPSELGLSKTVFNKLLGGGNYKTTNSSSSGKKSSSGSSHHSKSSSVSGGGIRSAGRLNKLGPVTSKSLIKDRKIANASSKYFNAYASVFNRSGKKPSTGGRSASVTCPNCGSSVSASSERCPVCGANL